MTLRARLFLAIAGLSAVLVLPALLATDRLADLREVAVELRQEETAALQSLGSLRGALDRLDRRARGWVVGLDSAAGRRVHGAMAEARSALARLEASGYGDSTEDARALMDAMAAAIAELDTLARTARADGTVDGSELERATDRFRYLPPLLARTRRSLDAVEQAIRRRSSEAALQAEAISRQASDNVLLALVLAFAVAGVVGVGITRIVTRPVHRLRRSMNRVAGGDFTPPDELSTERDDEFGDLHRAFRSMTEQLAELDRTKSEFVSVASHRLKTPISVLDGYTEMFVDGDFGPLSELQRDALGEMREQLRRLDGRVSQLVELSRAEAGTLPLEHEPVPVRDLLAAVHRDFEAQARQKDVRFSVVREDSAPGVVEADPDRLQNELIGNLLVRAFRAVGAGDRVRVVARGGDDRLVLEVTDTGPSLPPDELERAFEKRYQLEGGGDEPAPGLGLSIAREVARRHGGDVEAESEPGRGTVFRIELPIRREG